MRRIAAGYQLANALHALFVIVGCTGSDVKARPLANVHLAAPPVNRVSTQPDVMELLQVIVSPVPHVRTANIVLNVVALSPVFASRARLSARQEIIL